ncbi:MAG TPA: 50S ribosomal protein L11 methyltransferase [Spirochaetota bacterium]|nr:50S ribosomal protein L11 methyltransferase [Spirochaetota bacterium]HPJ42354.1 50S ribosomal protein L11 methyltransferase [Spirochaetota bacterium]HPR36117.1 50S ribosomal protein L11 methyltransferase [Spirochaetota bacterium]
MREYIFEIPESREELLTVQLTESGFTSFYFEKSGQKNFLKIYLRDNDLPAILLNETPISSSDVDPSSWSRVWGENYNGSELTENIFILPSGVTPPDKKYKTIIEIDPFDSFGDGHHPTTRLCGMLLEEILNGGNNAASLSMLDIGTGSGILSIAAWIMGIKNIDLFDYDSVAVEKASKNLKLNGINSLSPFTDDIYKFTSDKKYDIITANLLSRLIEDNMIKLISLLKPEGKIIVSGISTKWTEQMKKVFSANGFQIIKHRVLEEWNGFILEF